MIQNCYNTCVKGEGVVLVIRQIDTAEPVQARFRQVTQTLVYGLLFSCLTACSLQMVALPLSTSLGLGDLSKLSPIQATQYQFRNAKPCMHVFRLPDFHYIQRSKTVIGLV